MFCNRVPTASTKCFNYVTYTNVYINNTGYNYWHYSSITFPKLITYLNNKVSVVVWTDVHTTTDTLQVSEPYAMHINKPVIWLLKTVAVFIFRLMPSYSSVTDQNFKIPFKNSWLMTSAKCYEICFILYIFHATASCALFLTNCLIFGFSTRTCFSYGP